MITEKIELLGKAVYKDIPAVLTLKSFPGDVELDYVGSEDFERTMIEEILPKCVEEKVDFYNILEIDFYWICRCLRFLNYGPYFTTNMILCDNCGRLPVEAQVDLRVVECKPLPDDFTGDIVIKKEDLIDYKGDIHLHLLTMREIINMRKDKAFFKKDGSIKNDYARTCYSITSIGTIKNANSLTAKLEIEKNMTPADLKAVKMIVQDLTDYGLRGGGRCKCPRCGSDNAAFLALSDDKFFRPTLGDLRAGRNDRSCRGVQISARNQEETV